MKKGILLLVLSFIFTMTFAQITKPQWTSITSNGPETFKTQLISSSENSIKVNVQVPGFYTATVTTPRGEANVITVPKSVSTAHAGEPDMPMTGIPLMIGDKARMNVRVIDAQYMDFEGIEVAPSKGDFSRQIDPETVPYTYGECYSQDAFFPEKNLTMYEPYIIRDFRGQNMAVYPFAYNPVTKTLRVYYNMTVEMYKVDNNGSNIIEGRRGNEVKMSSDFKSVYQRHFLNFESGMKSYTPLDEEGDLLIICYDNFISNMTDFVNWKKTRGINTTIVGTSTAGSTYSAIKTYIQNQYNANNNITHVLLVGDVAQIPGYTYSGASGYEGKGDNAYGQIVGSDIYNDVFIGRFSASSAARVTTQCNRVITYERDLTTSASWLQIAEGIAKKEGGSGHNNEDDYQHMDVIRTDLLNYGYSTVYQRYENLSGYTATASQISSDINSGVGIINYCNHGAETMWGVASYSVSHVNALTNNNKLPFIFSVACLVGKYDHSSDCFAEAWMNATNNNNPTGAIGTLMSYISQPWIPPMWAQDECIDILCELKNNNIKHTWGGVSINGLFGIFDNYSTSTAQAVGTYQAWILYGDPSMMVRTKTPTAMTVSHDGTIPPSGGTYTVNVTNGNGTVATITDANHNILGKATVSNGSATINISDNLTVGTDLTLCIFGFNKQTYLGTISVVGGTQYTISTSASPTAGGTVDGAGQYYENTQCTLTATANNHYEFTKWTKNGTQVSTNNPYTFTVTGNATYVANFTALQPHNVTCNTAQNGTISASPTSAYKGETVTLTATPASGYCLGSWTVKDASNNTIPVTNNQFTMPDSNVTVSATFVVGYNVTLAPATNGTISANTTSGPAGTAITLTATPASGYVFDSWIVYKTGDVNNTVNVSGNSFTMPSFDVTVVGIFTAPQGGDQTVGSGTNTNMYLPTYAYYKYSLTQQIYTAAEMNGAGTITKIAFKVSNSKSTTRTLDVYLKHTSKTAFTSNTGWESVSSSNKVFSGSVTFQSSGWTTITLSTPFEYNGTSNLVVCVDDNTGSYVSSSSNSPTFYVYSTGANRALRIYNDNTNYTATSASSYSGTYITYNNQMVFTKEVSGGTESLSVSPNALSGFTYAQGAGPSTAKTVTVVACAAEDITVTAPDHYEVSNAANGTYGPTLTIPADSKGGRATLTYDFEDGTQGWTVLKGNTGNSPNNWHHNTEHVSYSSGTAHDWSSFGHNSSSGFMISESYISATSSSGSAYGAVTPDNYLISPQVTLGGSISFYAGARNTDYCAENFSVMVSTTNNTNTASFTTVETFVLSLSAAGYTDSPYTVDLSAYSGTGYIAIRHWDCNDQWVLCIDDITIEEGGSSVTPDPDPNPTNVSLVTANVYVRLKAGLTQGEYNGETLTVTTGDITSNVTLNGEVTQGDAVPQTVSLASGWNWWSTNLNITMADLETALGTKGKTIKDVNGDYNSYRPSGQWNDGIEEFHIEQMYKIQTSEACTITLNGALLNPSEHPITIVPGANWIGFPLDHPVDVSQAFTGFTPTKNDVIKAKDGTYVTYRTSGWSGSFTLNPGEGYIYQSKASSSQTMKFSSEAKK